MKPNTNNTDTIGTSVLAPANIYSVNGLYAGQNAAYTGSLVLANGNTSGASATIKNTGATTAYNFNLPASAGTAGQPLLSGGGLSNAQTYGTLGIAAGGTGATTASVALSNLGGIPVVGGTTGSVVSGNFVSFNGTSGAVVQDSGSSASSFISSSATSNSTLTTLSGLSLPGSQVSGNISGNAANITATSNSTITTLSSLALPTNQVTGYAAYMFGSGIDGALTVTTNNLTSGPISSGALVRDVYFTNLTISGSGAIETNGYRIYVNGTLNLTNASSGAIYWNGNVGNNASSKTGAAELSTNSGGTVGGWAAGSLGGTGSLTGNGGNGSRANTTTLGGLGGTGGTGGASGSNSGGTSLSGTLQSSGGPIGRVTDSFWYSPGSGNAWGIVYAGNGGSCRRWRRW